MARRDYLTPDERGKYEVGTQVQFKPTQYARDYKPKRPWYRYVPGYLAMAPAAALVTLVVNILHLNVLLQMVLVIGLAFAAKLYVDWRLGV